LRCNDENWVKTKLSGSATKTPFQGTIVPLLKKFRRCHIDSFNMEVNDDRILLVLPAHALSFPRRRESNSSSTTIIRLFRHPHVPFVIPAQAGIQSLSRVASLKNHRERVSHCITWNHSEMVLPVTAPREMSWLVFLRSRAWRIPMSRCRERGSMSPS